jgi:bloom syndrome protein
MDLLVLAPTGLGKSLCFQVPALAEQHGITLVISPLLGAPLLFHQYRSDCVPALMRDQIAKLRSLGVPAAALTSNSTPQDRARVRSIV